MPLSLKIKRKGLISLIILFQFLFFFLVMFTMYKRVQTSRETIPTPETCDREINLHRDHPEVFMQKAKQDYERFKKKVDDSSTEEFGSGIKIGVKEIVKVK